MVHKNRTVVTTNLDIDFLRTLVSAEDLGGMNRAAEQVGRSQSAVSQQMRKLEEKIGQRLFRKQGRGLMLTEPGNCFSNMPDGYWRSTTKRLPLCAVLVSKAWCGSACQATLPKPGCRRRWDSSSGR